jgi:hypothetical protein
MAIAKIEGGRVVQVDRTTDDAPEGWRVVGDHVVCGMVESGDDFAAPEPAAPTAREAALAEIARIERSITPRRQREALLTDQGKAWLAARDAEIATERAKL